MTALARLLQFEHGAPRHDLATVAQERVQHLAQVQQTRLAVDQCDHVDAETVLHRRQRV